MKRQKMKLSNTWSPLSNATVSLKPSKDYQKLLCLMYGVLVLALLTSNFYWLLCFILSVSLSAYFIYLSALGTPGAACIQIQYIKQQWRVYKTPMQFKMHSSARIKFDFGWLMWLIFEGESTEHVLLFRDQMSLDDHRLIRVLLRVAT